MLRNWKTLTMISMLSAATISLAPPPVFAGEGKDSNEELKKSIDLLIKRIASLEQKPTDEEAIAKALRSELKKLENGTLADIKKSIDQANTDIGAVQSEQRKHKKLIEDQKFLIDLLTGRIDNLEKKIVAGGGSPTPAVDKAFMDEFRTMLKSLNDTLARFGPTQERKSMSPPTTGNGDATGQGQVMLANHYSEELLFIINGVGHRLSGRSTKLVPVPAGVINYEVFSTRFGVLERRTTNLASGHTFNLAAQ